MDTLHMKLQIIGKVRLALTRREPQWANVPLYLTARGLTTSPIWSGGARVPRDVGLIHPQRIVAANDGGLERAAPAGRPGGDVFYQFVGRPPPPGIRSASTHPPP